jgi:glycosyltransferase involved in cell wall biosynthesis
MTSAREHGEMTLEMLQVDTKRLRKERDKLFEWLEQSDRPHVICLSTALLAGFADELKRRLGAPVVLFFQGEDTFLDGLPEPFRSECWKALKERLTDSDALLAPSRFYAGFMSERLGLAPDSIEVVSNGIRLDGYAVSGNPPAVPTVGYLARMSRDKGLELFVDAFIVLAGQLGDAVTRLRIAGAATAGDQPFIAGLKRRLAGAGLESRVDWSPNLTLEAKMAFLRSLTLFSVPATYAEAFGLYVLEAMACGIPVVQPDASAFPEIIGATGGGVCVAPANAGALAGAWQRLLANPVERAALGRAARSGVEKHFSAEKMCEAFCQATARVVRATA